MRTKASIFTTLFLLTAGVSLLPGIAHGAGTINGRAVTAIHDIASPVWDAALQPTQNRSKLVVVTVSNGAVTSTDTILRNQCISHPTWSFDGTRIVFAGDGKGMYIVDADGKNMKTIWSDMVFGFGSDMQNISWPAIDGGKWVYFHRKDATHGGEGTCAIWRVNVEDTTKKEMIFDYMPGDNWCTGVGACMRRWSVSADATYAVYHVYMLRQNNMGPDGGPHFFPQLSNGRLAVPQCVDPGNYCDYGCNLAVSASGKYIYHFEGSHTGIYFHKWNHAQTGPGTQTGFLNIGTGASGSLDQFKDIETWLQPATIADKESFACVIWDRGAANSDKIVTTIVGYRYTADYMEGSSGGNGVIIDWVDKKATLITNNPKPPVTNPLPNGQKLKVIEPPDFFVTGGKSGCYEDSAGNWIPVPGATAVRDAGNRSGLFPASAFARTAVYYDIRGARIGAAGPGSRSAAVQTRRGVYLLVGQGTPRKSVGLMDK